ncbi:MAG: allophanate hydrolase [bacterium]
MSAPSLDLLSLRAAYRDGSLRPADVIDGVLARSAARGDDHVWIHRLGRAAIEPYLQRLTGLDPSAPLWGVPFAIKDNIDLAGVPTTAACPAFAYTPESSATAVARAIAAGAIPIGKVNLDQFATGLVGVRSPFGVARNPFDATMIPGGSSSGSAVAVAAGLVSFAFGTDTAGSGRVPAAFNNLVGLKPTRGLISTAGVVPACRSLDCVSIFALSVGDAAAVLGAVAGFDTADPFSRPLPEAALALPGRYRVGVPLAAQREWLGNAAAAALFDASCARLRDDGVELVDVDIAPLLEAGALLYDGPWVAERYAAIRPFIDAHPEALHPVTRAVIEGGARPSAADAFTAYYRLRELRRACEPTWQRLDALLLPTAACAYTIAAVEAEPLRLNAQLGRYTNFVNLLDLCGVAVPAGFQPDGFPFGVTLLAPAFREALLLPLAARLRAAAALPLGVTPHRLPAAAPAPVGHPECVDLVVCGAHMAGLPLNHQLTDRGARLVAATQTAPEYRLVALPDGRPGLERVAGGAAIAVEVWSMPVERFGSFVAAIPPPLAIGTVRLADGRSCKGFLCETIAAAAAADITHHGGWRAYLAAR